MALLERILGIILPVFIIIAIGYGFARARGESAKAQMGAVNSVSMGILCPLLVFTALAGKDFDVAQNGMLLVAGLLISIGSGVLAWPVAKLLGYDVRTFVPPMMYNNCGNMGLPLAVLAFGPAALSAAVALFMASNLVYFTLGIRLIESGREHSRSSLKLLFSPMMVAMMLGMACAIFKLRLPEPLFLALKMLGEACIPIMLFALGVRMVDVSLRSWHIGVMGAIVCPLAGIAVAWLFDQFVVLPEVQRGQMYLFAALPPAVFCFMIAEQYKQEPDKVASIVLLGNLAATLFVPLGLWIGMHH